MKKKWLAIGIAAIILAGVLYIGGMSYLEWDYSRLDGSVWEQKEFSAETDNIKSASIKVFSSEVKFVQGDTLKVEYQESNSVKYDITYENGEFSLTEKYKWHFSLFRFRSPAMTITLPETQTLNIKSSNGDFILSDCSFDALNVNITNGDIGLTRVDVKNKLYVKSSNGGISLWDVNAGDVEIKNTNGSIALMRVKSDSVKADTVNGELEANAVTAKRCLLSTVNGEIKALNMVTDNIELSNVNGEIEASFVFALEVYKIDAHTVNGEVNVGNRQQGVYSIEAETVNGDIKLFFGAGA